MSSLKVFFDGTHRVRPPSETWDLLAPRLPQYGVTRVADVTGLDVLGVPVSMAVRPLAKTLSVSQGKGRSLLAAKVSAVMESVEVWHAENAHPQVRYTRAAACDLDLGYDVDDLSSGPGGLFTDSVRLDWVAAEGLLTRRQTALPVAVVCACEPSARSWHPAGLGWNSNGLASGNSYDEAVLHGLYEVIERDGLSRLPRSGPPAWLDLATLTDSAAMELIDRIDRAGASLQVGLVPTRPGVPCFVAWLWSEDFAVHTFGCGAHLAPEVALLRAVTEAAQSRLTAIVGSRDDLAPIYPEVLGSRDARPGDPPDRVSWPAAASAFGTSFVDVSEERAWLVSEVHRAMGVEPIATDLSTEDDFAVVRVVVPGARFDGAHAHAIRRPDTPAAS